MSSSPEARARKQRVNMLGGLYGLCLGAGMAVFTQILPQPWFGVAFFLLMALSMARLAIVLHRRMRLPLSLFASVNGVLFFATFALLHAQGQTLATLPHPWFWILPGAALMIGALMLVERIVYSEQHDAWAECMADKSFVDVLLMRHIPDLRHHKV